MDDDDLPPDRGWAWFFLGLACGLALMWLAAQ